MENDEEEEEEQAYLKLVIMTQRDANNMYANMSMKNACVELESLLFSYTWSGI